MGYLRRLGEEDYEPNIWLPADPNVDRGAGLVYVPAIAEQQRRQQQRQPSRTQQDLESWFGRNWVWVAGGLAAALVAKTVMQRR